MTNSKEAVAAKRAGLGTFAGVFTPSILTILGIIFFQRLGFVVGGGGLTRTLGIIAIATVISVITSLSLSAIATNIRVKGGGDYYLISRTLGIHFGGALGLVLFVAQSVSVAFYCIGFGEAVATMLGHSGESAWVAIIAASATLAIGIIAFVGADLATKFQFVVMAALAAALVSFYFGGFKMANLETLLHANAPLKVVEAPSFAILFAIFFPAVTGFTQGVSMSGDLRDPAESLPRGTFWAVGISTVVYASAAVLFAACLTRDDLATDYSAMRKVAAVPWLIDAGVIAATLSSAMASFLGAPRILQSLAQDNVIPPLRMFAAGSGATNNPRRAVLLAGGVALVTIALGNLNAVAAVVGMCFLLSYGLLNYATFVEARTQSPSFRPTFKYFNAWLSLAGGGICLGAGILISPIAAAVAGAMMVALHQYLRRVAPESSWADSRYAYHFRRVRDHLIAMRDGSDHPRDWRPHVLALCNDPLDRAQLLQFASWIDGDSGFTTAVRILTPKDGDSPERVAVAEEMLRHQIEEAGLETFARVMVAPTVLDGLSMLIQSHGLGSLRANTILMSAHEQFGAFEAKGDAPPASILNASFKQGRNLVLLDGDTERWTKANATEDASRRIDVWWKDDATSQLCLLLAHLMTRSDEWRDATIHVHAIADGPTDQAEALSGLEELLEEARIEAIADSVDFEGPGSLLQHSKDATLIFLPLRVRGRRLVGPKGGPIDAALDALPVTALVVAGEDIDLDAEHDEPADADDRAEAASK